MNYEKFGAAVTLTDKELCECVNAHTELVEPNDISDMIISFIERLNEHDRAIFDKALPGEKVILVCSELYKLGVVSGMYLLNEAIKEQFKDMQARKKEREYRKVHSDNAKA